MRNQKEFVDQTCATVLARRKVKSLPYLYVLVHIDYFVYIIVQYRNNIAKSASQDLPLYGKRMRDVLKV